MRRLRWAWRILLACLLVPPSLGLLLVGVLQTGIGQRQAASWIGDLASGPDLRLEIGGIDGFVPFDVTVRDVVLADGRGPWARIDRAHLAWSPSALWNGVLQVDALTAGRIALDRLPVAGAPTPSPEAAEPVDPAAIRVPDPPLGLRLDRLLIQEIALGAPVLGVPARLTVDGTARLVDPGEGLRVTLTVARIDEMPGQIALTAGFVPEGNRLTIALDAAEPPGGMLAALIGLPGEPLVEASLHGDGPLTDWAAALQIDAGMGFNGAADIRIEQADSGYALAILGGFDLAALLPSDVAPMLAGGLTLDARLDLAGDGAVEIAQVEVDAAAGSVRLSGRFDPRPMTADLSVEAVVGDPAAFADLLPAIGWRDIRARGSLSGPLTAPSLTVDIEASDVTGVGIGADRLAIALAATPDGDLHGLDSTMAVTARASAGNLAVGDPAFAALFRPTIDLAIDGAVGPDGRLALDRAVLTLPALRLTAQGQASHWGNSADISATLAVPDLGVLTDLAGLPLAGALSLDVTAARHEETTDIDVAASIADFHSGVAPLDGALGANTIGALRGTVSDDGTVRVPVLSLDAGALTLNGENLHLTNDGAGGTVTLTIPRLADIDPTLAGAITLAAGLSGSVAAPAIDAVLTAADLDVAGIVVPAARLRLNAADLAGAPRGSLELDGEAASLPVGVSLQFAVQNRALAVDDVRAAIGGARLDGSLAAGFDGLVAGTLSASIADLSDFAVLAGQSLSGAVVADIDLSADAGQSVAATLRLSNLAVADSLRIADATFRAALADVLGTPQIDAALTAAGIAADGIDIDQADATARGGVDALAVGLGLSGPQLTLDAAADLALAGESTRIGLTGMTVGYAGEALTLAQSAVVEIAAADVIVDGLILAARQGRIALDGRYAADALDLSLGLSNLPLSLAGLAAPDLAPTGLVNGRATLAGSLANPSGTIDVAFTDVALADSRALGLPGVDATVSGRWNGRQLDLRTAVRSNRIGEISLIGALPLVMDPAGVPSVPETQSLSASLEGRLDLAVLNTLLADSGSQTSGTAALNVTVGGTIADPQPTGTVRLIDASYTDPVNGISLTGIGATLTGDGQAFNLTDLSGSTPGGGTLSGGGTLTLDPDAVRAIDLVLSLSNADLIASELLTGTVDADLSLRGSFLEALLAGTVTVRQAVLRIPDSLPASVPTLDVEVVNAPPDVLQQHQAAPAAPARNSETAAFDLQLDVAVSAPQEVYVRGRGLNVEVGGEIRATGSAVSPRLDGALALRRGDLDLLGNRFSFERGRVAFLGEGEIDPALDFFAVTQADGLDIQVGISGRASAPSFALSSQPEVPEDEILSRLLFGRSSSQLSPVQAIQLAQSAATLAGLGGSEGLLGSVRDALGVDRLEITGGTADDGMSVRAGRYVGDGVYVGVEQGLGQGASEVVVEVEITDNITVETDVGSDATGRVGVNFQWDY